jgi:hypothetical protein
MKFSLINNIHINHNSKYNGGVTFANLELVVQTASPRGKFGGKMQVSEVEVPLAKKYIPEIYDVCHEERPIYRVIKQEGAKEIRDYEDLVIVKTKIYASYEEARHEGHLRLTEYLFSRNGSPLVNSIFQEKEAEGWTMTLILSTKQDPLLERQPIDCRVKLFEVPNQRWAVLRYNGNSNEMKMRVQAQELEAWLSRQSEYRGISSPRWVQHEAPFLFPFLRRNEVQIQVEFIQ